MMPYWPPDSAPTVPEMMPQASTPGPAAVPYNGPGFALGSDIAAPVPDVSPASTPGPGVLDAATGGATMPVSPLAAPNVNPYEAGAPDPIYVGGDADAGGRDTVAASVAQAVANAEARFGELRGDTYGMGSHIGDLISFPPSPLDTPAGPGETDPSGHYYDPPRAYGNEPQ
jgi:hypothetical protein